MKTKILTTLILLVGFVSCRQAEEPGYTVNGQIEGLTGKVYLNVYEGKLPNRLDSAEVENGQFTFSGKVNLPMYSSIESAGEGTLVYFFIENSPIEVHGNLANKAGIQVSGSTEQDRYSDYQKYLAERYPASRTDSLRMTNPAAANSLERVESADKLAYVGKYPGSIAMAYVLYRQLSYTMTPGALDSAVAGFDPAIRNSVYLQLVATMSEALKKTAVGQSYTDISGPDPDGKIIALSDVLATGKYVLLDFWASWCPPCRAEAPYLVSAHTKYHDNFTIYAVSLDRNKDAWLKGIKDLGFDWVHVSEVKFWESAAADTYGVRSIPSNVLIAPDGKIIARNLMGPELEETLASLLSLE